MAEITAKLVNELRSKTGLAMMECKKMLTEVGGDIEKAIEAFRKKGVKTSITERAATEGRVIAGTSPDKATSAMRNALESGDDRSYGRADTAFHKNFFTFCGNRLVQDAYQLAEGRIATIRTLLTAPNKEQRELSFSEHCMIADALRMVSRPIDWMPSRR